MPTPKTVHSDATQKVIDKTLAELRLKLPASQFAAINKLAQEGRLLDVEFIVAVAKEDSDERVEQ